MPTAESPRVAVIGGGPAGLMAAETLAGGGVQVDLFDAMPSVGRKFLLAGKGGLNLTHSEPLDAFLPRYGTRRDAIEPMLRGFGAQALRDWAQGLGVETFVGSSGRVFPTDMKAAPLLRAWLRRLRESGAQFLVIAKYDPAKPTEKVVAPEMTFAEQDPQHFIRVFDNEAGSVFRIVW